MSVQPLITFKAGLCENEGNNPIRVCPRATKGYLFVHIDEATELPKLCWHERMADLDEMELELLIPPGDVTFTPYKPSPHIPTSNCNGRFFVLKFASSSDRQFFWMQSRPQRPEDPSWFSPRDLKIGDIVNRLLNGEDVDVNAEMAQVSGSGNDGGNQDGDGDEAMEDAEGTTGQQGGSGGAGGAGAGATGGDVREEGESSREGGADGARAASSSATQNADTTDIVRNLLASLRNNPNFNQGIQQGGQQGQADKPYPFLTHLLTPETMISLALASSEDTINHLLGLLPPSIVILAATKPDGNVDSESTPGNVEEAIGMLSVEEKRIMLMRVMRCPQLQQSLFSLTQALRDGGLPDVAGALGVDVENGGRLPGGMPLGGDAAVAAFVDGVKKSVHK